MHVAFICNEYPPGPHGGVGSLTQTIARRLVDAGHQATVIGNYRGAPVAGGDRIDDDEGVAVIRLASPRIPGLRPFAEQRRIWRRLRAVDARSPIDVVDGPEPSFWAAPRRLPFPLVARMNGGHRFFAEAEHRPTAPARRWIESRSLRRADDLVSVSAYTAERTAALVGLGDRPITVIPNPVDPAAFTPGGQPEPDTVAFFGTLCEKKGVRQLVEGFPAVVRQVPGARLLIAGRDQTDPETGGSFQDRLQAAVAPLVADRVEFLGPLDHEDVHALIARATVCALPSHMEALPVAWLEVLASGRALVASSTGPGPEVVVDEESGLLVDPHDPAAIAAAVARLLADPALRARLGRAGRERVVQRFSIAHLIEVNLDHYGQVLDRWPAPRHRRRPRRP